MLIQMKLRAGPFERIRRREKTIELRLNDEKRRQIAVGDEIEFTNTESGEKLRVRVTARYPFESFEQLYAALPLSALGYSAKEAASADPRDMDAYYSREEQARWGVLGLKIEVIG